MKPVIQIDEKAFQKALRDYTRATKKEFPDVLNRAAKNMAYRAASFTPKTTAAKVRSELNGNPKMLAALTAIHLRKKGRRNLAKGEFKKEMRNFASRRASSVSFMRSGWAKAIQEMGGSFRGRSFPKTHVGGGATRARLFNLAAEVRMMLLTDSPGSAHAISYSALSRSVAFVANDMQEYALRKMSGVARRHSAK